VHLGTIDVAEAKSIRVTPDRRLEVSPAGRPAKAGVAGGAEVHELDLEVPGAGRDPAGGAHHAVAPGADGGETVVGEVDPLGLEYAGEEHGQARRVVVGFGGEAGRGDEEELLLAGGGGLGAAAAAGKGLAVPRLLGFLVALPGGRPSPDAVAALLLRLLAGRGRRSEGGALHGAVPGGVVAVGGCVGWREGGGEVGGRGVGICGGRGVGKARVRGLGGGWGEESEPGCIAGGDGGDAERGGGG
jgi:hypothetical protein